MSIRSIPLADGTTATVATGAGIVAYRLLAIRSMLKLEKLGMKNSRGAIRPKVAKEFGLSPRDPYEAYLEFIEKRLAVVKAEVAAENMTEDAIEKAMQP